MKKILFCFLFLYPFVLIAQTNEEDEHTSSIIYGINFNTNGGTIGGANIKYTRIQKRGTYTAFALEVVAIKHPQEIRITNNGTNRFIFGKQNYLYSVRPTYGIERLIFRKAPEESIQVMANIAVGPSLGVEVPYYINYKAASSQVVTTQPYLPTNDWRNIEGTAGIFEGAREAKIIPALFVKGGITLEFGEFRNNITGVEVGFTSELFARAPRILAPEAVGMGPSIKNKQYMIGGYLTVFLGSRK